MPNTSTTDLQRMESALSDAEASAASSFLDSPLERAYGTFEVSLIEVESDAEQPLKASKSADFDAHGDDAATGCSGDCCAIMAFLWLPFRLSTYKIVAFHLLNVLWAISASAWTVLFYTFKLVVASVSPWSPPLRRLEASSLSVLLHADAALFNTVCPRAERIMVFSSSTSSREDTIVYGFYAQLYFGVAKLVCSAVPGFISAAAFAWTIRYFFVVLLSSPSESAPIEKDVLLLLALLAVYAAAGLTKAFAVISRHITIFFCAEHLLYSSM